MLVANIIREKLTTALETSNIEIIDESAQHAGHAGAREGGESHFAVIVVSEKFQNLSRVARHKLIYSILDNEMKTKIHALRIQSFTNEEAKIKT